MVTIELRFLAGRFHATPWGRNVNEGVPEWPPAPYRLARALIDVAKRRRPDWSDERLAAVVSLTATPVCYVLPSIQESHTRSYLSSNERDPARKQKIFDAFVVVAPTEPVLMSFAAAPPPEVLADFDELLGELNYFGRSESWVRAARRAGPPPAGFNGLPAHASEAAEGTLVADVACVRPPAEYVDLPIKPTVGKDKQALGWLDALAMGTGELIGGGWSSPPAQTVVSYRVPAPGRLPRPRTFGSAVRSRFNVARYALASKVLPRTEETLPFAERVRLKLMGIHRRIMGGDPSLVSPVFSGKQPDGTPRDGHGHAFYLPLDSDGDGRLDHLLVEAADGFDSTELQALDTLDSLWQADGKPDVRLVLMSLQAEPGALHSRRWVSATPYVTARHHRRGRGDYEAWLRDELLRELGRRDLPAPSSIEMIDRTNATGHALRWFEFTRSRKGSRPARGHGFVLGFDEEVRGPFALGALAHFGLGLFVPEDPS